MAIKTLLTIAVLAIAGIGIYTTQADAWSNCNTTCNGYGNYRNCQTYCY